jgi:hypothetical protein
MLISEPLSVYKCYPATICPGGEAGVCGGGRIDKACGRCEDGWILKDGVCARCDGHENIAIWFVWPAVIVLVVVVYYVNSSQKSAKACTLFCTATMFSMMINLLQMFSVFAMFAVPWPSHFKKMVDILAIMTLDFELVSMSCAYGNSAFNQYVPSVIFFPCVIGMLALGFVASKLVFYAKPSYQWTFPRVCTTMGTVCQMAFVTMASIGFASLTCYGHPNGLTSIQRFPSVICWTAEHHALIVPGAILLLFALSFYVLAIYLAVVVPKRAAAGNTQFLASTRFLFGRFHADCWWWGCVLLMRALCFTMIPVVARDNGRLQLILVNLVLITASVFQIRCWSWKVPLLNVSDAAICILMAMTSTTASAFMEKETGSNYETFSNLLIAQVGMLYGLCLVVLLISVVFVVRRGPMGETHDFFNLQKSPNAGVMTHQFLELVRTTEGLEEQEDTIKDVFKQLPFYDVMTIDHAFKIFSVSGLLSQFGKRNSGTRVMPRRLSVSSNTSADGNAALPTLMSSAVEHSKDTSDKEVCSDKEETVV